MSKGGEVIQKIQAETNTIINIEEEGDYGIVDVASSNKEDIAAALKWIKDICTVPEVGDIFNAKVVSIVEFGAFMELLTLMVLFSGVRGHATCPARKA